MDPVQRAKQLQDFDGNPPRCATCVFFRREPHKLFTTRTVTTRRGKTKTIRVPMRSHPTANPVIDRCAFGNFQVKPHAVCSEWRNQRGEVIGND